jgi:hypothetical protein
LKKVKRQRNLSFILNGLLTTGLILKWWTIQHLQSHCLCVLQS